MATPCRCGLGGRRHRAWAEEAATLLALVEAGIDFSDQEDVVAIAPAELTSRLHTLIAAIESHLGSRAGAEARVTLPRVVLAGDDKQELGQRQLPLPEDR